MLLLVLLLPVIVRLEMLLSSCYCSCSSSSSDVRLLGDSMMHGIELFMKVIDLRDDLLIFILQITNVLGML